MTLLRAGLSRIRSELGGAGLGPATTSIVGVALLVVLTGVVMTLPAAAQIAALLGIAAVVAFLAQPGPMLVAFLLGRLVVDLLWWVPGSVATMNVMELYAGAVTALTMLLMVVDLRRVDGHPGLPPFLVYLVVLVVGGLRQLETRAAAEIIARFLSPLILMLLFTGYFRERAERLRIVKLATLVAVIPVAISIKDLLGGQMSQFMLAGYHRLIGGYENLHNHALSMMLFCTFALWWVLEAEQFAHRLAAGVMLGSAALCLYFTYVRTALLGLAVFAGVYLLVTGRRRLLVLGAVAVAVFVLVDPAMQDRFKDLVLVFMPHEHVVQRSKLGSGRVGLWTASVREYLKRPFTDILLGLGIGKHWLLTRAYYNPYAVARNGYVDTHNDYLNITFQLGPIASGMFVFMQAIAIRAGLYINRYSPNRLAARFGAYVVALTSAAMVTSFVSNAFVTRVTLSWYYWSFVGLALAEYLSLRQSPGESVAPSTVPAKG